MSKHEDAIKEGARGLLEPGEEISSELIVSPRGSGTAMAGGVAAGEIGARWSNRNRGAAEDAGLVIKRNCGLALTDRRLLALDLAISMMGGVKEVKEVLSEVPIDQVERAVDAAERSRTSTSRRTQAPEACASTSSATAAGLAKLSLRPRSAATLTAADKLAAIV